MAYLLYLGLKLIFGKPTSRAGKPVKASAQALYWRGFVTSAANPKAVIFFAALFPQFIDPALALAPQFIILSLTYLSIDALFLGCYGKFADVVAQKLKPSAQHTLNKLSGGFLIGAAVLLGLKDIEVDKSVVQ